MPIKQFKKKPLTVYFTHEEVQRLNATAFTHRTTVSELIRAVVIEHGLDPKEKTVNIVEPKMPWLLGED